jgi:hypothetical protein
MYMYVCMYMYLYIHREKVCQSQRETHVYAYSAIHVCIQLYHKRVPKYFSHERNAIGRDFHAHIPCSVVGPIKTGKIARTADFSSFRSASAMTKLSKNLSMWSSSFVKSTKSPTLPRFPSSASVQESKGTNTIEASIPCRVAETVRL